MRRHTYANRAAISYWPAGYSICTHAYSKGQKNINKTTIWYGRGAVQVLLQYCASVVPSTLNVRCKFGESSVKVRQRCGEGSVRVWRRFGGGSAVWFGSVQFSLISISRP